MNDKQPATMREAFGQAVENLRPGYPAAWDLYLRRLTPVAYQSGTLTVAAPDERTRDICALRLQRLIRDELLYVTSRTVDVEYVLQGCAPC
jgi:hypothetical protein